MLQIFSILFLFLGILITLRNYYCLVRINVLKNSPSMVPLFGGLFLSFGAGLSNNWISDWWFLSLIIDPGCFLFTVAVLVSHFQEGRRFSKKKRILYLELETDQVTGTISLYPENDSIFALEAKETNETGSVARSLIMKTVEYKPDERIVLELQKIRIEIIKDQGCWKIERHDGEDERHQILNLKNATVVQSFPRLTNR